jgi:MarR-like DNA-binding transcriptional regulator SgrR of sgrS sRNA
LLSPLQAAGMLTWNIKIGRQHIGKLIYADYRR